MAHRPLLVAILLWFGLATPACAAIEKFVYVFAADGSLLAPDNAAPACPDPGASTASAQCKAVAVLANGDYTLKLAAETLSASGNLTLLANEYEHLASGDYVLLDSKRRGEFIYDEAVNTGVDISQVSEAGVRAVESAAGLTAAAPGTVTPALAQSVASGDMATLNETLGIAASSDPSAPTPDPLLRANQNQLDDGALQDLQALAELAVRYGGDPVMQELLKKNLEQGLLAPELLGEAKERTFTHVAQLETYGSDAPIMVLDADKYVIVTDQSAQLTTTRSVNAAAFFGYTWMGVDSETSAATFTRPQEDSYLVCVSGETDAVNALQTDCVRMRVRGAVQAITSASVYRTPTGSTLAVLGSASINASAFHWSGDGYFADPAAADTHWTAPSTPGTYELTLTVDDGASDSVRIEVYDVLPLARAEAVTFDAETGFAADLISHSLNTDGSAVDRVLWEMVAAPLGATVELISPDAPHARLHSDTQGLFTIALTAYTGSHSNQTKLDVRLRDTSGIVVHAGPDRVAYRGQTVRLDGGLTAKLSTTMAPLSYHWTLPNDVAAVLGNTDAMVATFVAAQIGDYTATLTVSDGRHSVADTVAISVRNRIPVAFDEWGIDATMDAPITGHLRAYDGDNDTLRYILFSRPTNGALTVDPVTGDFTYLHGGEKACHFKPSSKPADNGQGGLDVPVLKLCADKYFLQPGEVATLTTSNSIAVTKFSAFHWVGVTSADSAQAAFSSNTPGTYKVCIVGDVAQSRQTSTACVELVVGTGASSGPTGTTGTTTTSGATRCDEVARFQFKVNDSIDDSNLANVVLTVGCENTPPVANEATLSTSEDQAVNGTLTASEVNPQTLSFRVASAPARGSVRVTNPVTGEYTYTPNPDADGEDSFTFTAFDGIATSLPATVTIHIEPVDDMPRAAYSGRVTTAEDVAFGGTLTASDPDGDTLRYDIVTAPTLGAVVVDATTGAFVYTPNPQINGNDTFVYRVYDGKHYSGNVTVPVLIVPADDAPVATDVGPLYVNPSETISANLSGSDIDSASLRFALITSPTKGRVQLLDPASGAFAYVANAGTRGADGFQFRVSDATQDSAPATVAILINGANQVPVAYSSGPLLTAEDQSLSAQLTASDPDDDPLTYTLVNTGTLGQARLADAKTGAFVYTPNANANGSDSITFKVNDGFADSTLATVAITVTPVNDAPTAADATFTVHANETLTGVLGGTDIDADVLTYRLASAPAKGTVALDPATGRFQYTPSGSVGQDGFRFVTEDSVAVSSAATVTINITAVNQAPTVQDAQIAVVAGQSAQGTVVAQDPDSQSLTIQLLATPRVGQVVITDAARGTFRYAAAPGATGSDYFTVRATDGEKTSNVATITVVISDAATLCRGRSVALSDRDSDGYSDFVEHILGSNPNDAQALPGAPAAGVFDHDSDADGFSDVRELWLGTDPFDALSVKAMAATAYSDCFDAEQDVLPPTLTAWHVLAPDSDPQSGAPRMRFAFTALDNAAGVAVVTVSARSPSGVVKTAMVTAEDHPLIVSDVVSFDDLGSFAEAGRWTIERLLLVDFVGNQLELDRAGLLAMNCACTVDISNGQSDTEPPQVISFSVLTPTLDVTSGTATASFAIDAQDAGAGIASIHVTLQSPSAQAYRWADYATDPAQASVTTTLATNPFAAYAEAGTWVVAELSLVDAAGQQLQLDQAALNALGCTCQVQVSNSAPDTAAPAVVDFQVLTPRLDISSGNAVAHFRVEVSDAMSGVRDITLTLQSPQGDTVTAFYSSATGAAQVTATLSSAAFTPYAELGIWQVSELTVSDRNGNGLTLGTEDLRGLSYATDVELYLPTWRCCGANHAPEAFPGHLSTSEDHAVTGVMSARDADNDMLMFELVSQGTLGTLRITNPEAGTFEYTPKADAFGSDTFSFRVSDGRVNSKVAQVTVTIAPVNDVPLANAQTIEVIQDRTFTGRLSGTDVEHDALQYSLHSQGQLGVATVNSDGTFGYVPAAGTIGSDSFTYLVSDGTGSSTPATVSVKIVGEVRLVDFQVLTPVVSALDTLVTVSAAVTLSADISTLSDVNVTARLPGQMAIAMSRTLTAGSRYPIIITSTFDTRYTPLPLGTWEFADLFANVNGHATRSWVAKDLVAAGFDPHFRVLGNHSPSAVTDRVINLVIGTTFTGTLGASDADGDALTYRLIENGAKGVATITDAAHGNFRYVAQAVGVDATTYRVNDGKADSNVGRITFNIARNNGAPVAYAGSIVVNKDTAYFGSLVASDADNDPLTFTIVDQGQYGTVTLSDVARGTYVYRPTRGALGADSFTFKVNDGLQNSPTARLSVTIVDPDKPPVANAQSITAFENVAYQGTLHGSDPEGDTLAYALVSAPAFGTASVDSATGRFVYTPQSGRFGSDSFSFRITAKGAVSNTATVGVTVLSLAQVCGAGGAMPGLDRDHDGYSDAVERMFYTSIDSAGETPVGLDANALGIRMTDDDDVDGYADYVEVWLGSNPADGAAKPSASETPAIPACFNPLSDGIKPRLLAFTPVATEINVGDGSAVVRYAMTVADNASGVRLARVNLLSPSGTLLTSAASFSDVPLLRGFELRSTALGSFAEAGTWHVTGVTLYDAAGNRLTLTESELHDAGFATTVVVSNPNGDAAAPRLSNFTVVTPSLDLSGGGAAMQFRVSLDDMGAGLGSLRIDMRGPTGVLVTARHSFNGAPSSATVDVATPALSDYAQAGIWRVDSLLLVDAAGNSVDLASPLTGLGFANSVSVVNPRSDSIAPALDGLTVLAPEVYPASGAARMSFAVDVSDDAAGVSTIRVDILGPSGQYLTAWGDLSANPSRATTVQIDTAVVSTLLEEGTWVVNGVEVIDEAGNSHTVVPDNVRVTVRY